MERHGASIECRVQWRLLGEALAQGSPYRAAVCFLQPPPVPFYLIRELFSRLRQRPVPSAMTPERDAEVL